MLLFVMLLQVFSKVMIVVDYQANRNYIIEFFCINKNKPELHCNGKCYLAKKLKKAEQAENKAADSNQKQKFEINLYCQALFLLPSVLPAVPDSSFPPYPFSHSSQEMVSIFHPPQFTV
ncbi:hypothetical protein [Pontibacter silvestris]|uniref:hypothetical protein n=1 Tax=Pontibacter silvestris TaxID=2305183 RepID=UPI001E52A964|nr:hypothetical protein [Pontibacter silvestris]MCC9136942.1 hypothetical protein [Pontibacter silvestris]